MSSTASVEYKRETGRKIPKPVYAEYFHRDDFFAYEMFMRGGDKRSLPPFYASTDARLIISPPWSPLVRVSEILDEWIEEWNLGLYYLRTRLIVPGHFKGKGHLITGGFRGDETLVCRDIFGPLNRDEHYPEGVLIRNLSTVEWSI